ncbi:MAG: hypothetical protein GF307_10605 [candidate division Zixibacteria bacterium]|nr:hypothetical protein [candidate division Zixibacteria bacterium]
MIFVCLLLTFCIFSLPALAQESQWENISSGLEYRYFKAEVRSFAGDSLIHVLRIDPQQWELKLYSISEEDEQNRFTLADWSKKFDLTAVINAGMYYTDFRTHSGFMKSGEHINNPGIVKDYYSAAAFGPYDDTFPLFKIFDLDETELDEIIDNYDYVIQNLRLIKRPGENRWTQQNKRWSEAALGEDSRGNALFIITGSPYSMYDFNEILLSLPLDIVAAQHLEGGEQAQMYIKHGGYELNINGSYETLFTGPDGNPFTAPIPNIIGIKIKTDSVNR